MAEGLNRVFLFGNLGADPELRVTPGGQAVLKLRMATTETYLDKNNVRQERTEWHRVTLWGKRGEALGKFLAKGDRIFVEGRLQTSSYEKNGEKRYSTDIVANNIILTGGRGRGGEAGGGYAAREGGGGGRRQQRGAARRPRPRRSRRVSRGRTGRARTSRAARPRARGGGSAVRRLRGGRRRRRRRRRRGRRRAGRLGR
ncbi:MAG TPA: single-stranded DNA-binding protein [Polyangiaceae bacterium]|nr:single-stranded DNA-binding protein [Polyangiaceae bacterium]